MNFNKENNRIYVIDEDGKLVGEITYEKLDENRYNINHTFVDEALRGKGIAKKLVQMAIEEIKSKGGTVFATCEYAKKYLEKIKVKEGK